MIRPYLPGDLWAVLPSIRQAELNEAHSLGINPLEALSSVVFDRNTVTVELCGQIVGVAGLIEHEHGFQPWAVFTDAIADHPIEFLKDCRKWINSHDVPMMNVIDARNEVAKRWLTWLGFSLGETEPMGINGEPFQLYRRGQWVGHLH